MNNIASFFKNWKLNLVKPTSIKLACAIVLIILSTATIASGEANIRSIPDHISTEKWTGDFDSMVERRKIRALVPFNKMLFFLDGPYMRGIGVELLTEFEKYINIKLQSDHIKLQIIFIPTPRDKLIPALLEGLGDIIVANLTITKERKKFVDFSDPFLTDVSEVIITSPTVENIKTIYDLAGKKVHVRPSSSYFENLTRINLGFHNLELPEINIIPVDEYLEDSDLLEMVNANLIPAVVIDNHKAQFWAEIFESIQVHDSISVHNDGEIAWAFRKESPKFKAVINEFVANHKKGTLLGNILFKRYLRENKWVRDSLTDKNFARLDVTAKLFKKYGEQYNFDWLLLAALGFQESQLDQSRRSHTGAVGVMQILPTTASDKNINIKNIDKLESNIHAGAKYLRFLQDRYFSDKKFSAKNRDLFTFAAYNAGPARVAKLRKEAEEAGLDPNVWFRNVEIIAAKKIGRETVQYVSNIYKYYIAYRLALDKLTIKKSKAK